MPKFTDGFHTTLGSRINTSKIQETLNVAMIRDNLHASSLDVKNAGSVKPVFVTGQYDSESSIPLFVHPMFYKTRDGQEILATDARLYLKKGVYDGSLASLNDAISNKVEYHFMRSRAIMNLEWLNEDVDSLKNNLFFGTMMFSRLIADVITRTYAIDGRDQIIVAIVASYYYQSLFSREETYDEDTRQKMEIHTVKTTQADPKFVREILGKMPIMKGIDSLIEGIKTATNNVRLKDFNLLILLTLLKNSWYGINAKEIIVVALEHPPTWIAVIDASLRERTYRSSLIYKIAERVGKRGNTELFLKNVDEIASRYKVSDMEEALAKARLG